MIAKLSQLFLIVGLLGACSGLVPDMPFSSGRVVAPEYLATYEGWGSISTLWYRGSDDKYHYFFHFVKTTTRYRVARDDLIWKSEFPLGSKDPVLVRGQLADSIDARGRAETVD